MTTENPYAAPASQTSDSVSDPKEVLRDMQPVYFPGPASAGGFLFGPLASVVFIHHNFKALGNVDGANKTIFFGAIILLLLLVILAFLPENFPRLIIPFITALITRLIVEKNQLTKQVIEESPFLTSQSIWRVLWIGLVCLAVMFVVLIVYMFILDGFGIIDLGLE